MLLILTTHLIACSGSRSERPGEWERRQISSPDLPVVQFQVYDANGQSSAIEVMIGLKPSSLVFLRTDSGFAAKVDLEVKAYREGIIESPVEAFWTEEIVVHTYQETQSTRTRNISRIIPLAPGVYDIDLLVTDRTSEKRSVRYRRFTLDDQEKRSAGPGKIRIIQGKTSEEGEHVLGPYAVAGNGPLWCSLDLRLTADTFVRVTLVRVGRDATVPARPYAFNVVQGSLAYGGFDPEQTDTLETLFIRPEGSQVTWKVEPSETGVYIIVAAGAQTASVQRTIVIMPAGFPRPLAAAEMVGSVSYLLREGERDALDSLTGEDQRRAWLEAFWRKAGGSEQKARNLVDLYYRRVQEANEYFSTFKPGWQTDRGMIYIVLGPPVSMLRRLNSELWTYSQVDGDVASTFEFRRVPLPEGFESFEHLILERQPFYDNIWIRGVDSWRFGGGF